MKRASDPVLLDTNVLIALGWSNHPHHAVVRERMTGHTGQWMTCAITQLGFVRLSANSAVTRRLVSPQKAADLLRKMTEDPMHVYIGELPPPESQTFERAIGHNQVTDAYLLRLSGLRSATFLTLDSRLTSLAEGVCPVEVLAPAIR